MSTDPQAPDTLPPVDAVDSVLPQPESWLEEATAAQQTAAAADQPGRVKKSKRAGKARNRVVMGAAAVAIGVLGYLNWTSKSDVPDLLGSELPTIPAELIASSLPQIEPVDPRLSGDLDLLGSFPEDRIVAAPNAAPVEPSAVFSLEDLPLDESVLPEQAPAADAAPAASVATATVEVTAPAPAPAPAAAAAAAAVPSQYPAPNSNAELLARLERMETMVALLQQQMELQTKINAAAARKAAAPVQVQAKPVQEPAPRKVAKATEAKITPAKRPRQVAAKTAQPEATKTAAVVPSKLSGQLVSVDMWNGQPSVVVASGLPGDRRVRVLRPGDVINGLALRSADPVSQSATFSAPGSAGLTLFVSQGG